MPSDNERTFKERVDHFWKWFSIIAEDYYEAIEAGNCADLLPEISIKVNELWEDFAWVFGPGPEEKGGHSFTISGEGLIGRQFLAEYCVSRAPDLPNWTFYASRQPGEIEPEMAIGMGDVSFDFGGLWVTPKLDEENEIVHLTAWHPVFEEAQEDKANTALFIMLDEVLGEHGTDQWLGEIKTSDGSLAGAIPVLELRDFLHDLEVERGWKKYPPTESYTSYEMEAQDDRFLRSDTIAGSTSFFNIVSDYLNGEGPVESDPLGKSGADAIFISYASDLAPRGGEVDFRGKIEDALTAKLDALSAGKVVGGAIGIENTYIDLVIFDGDRSLTTIVEVLKELKLPGGSAIHFFAAGKEGKRIIL